VKAWDQHTRITDIEDKDYHHQNSIITAENIRKQWGSCRGQSANGIDQFPFIVSDVIVVCDDEFEPYEKVVSCISMSTPNNPSFYNIGSTWDTILSQLKLSGCVNAVLSLFPVMNPMIAGKALKTALKERDYGLKRIFVVVLHDRDYQLFKDGWHAVEGQIRATVAFLNGCGPITVVTHLQKKDDSKIGIMNPNKPYVVVDEENHDIGFDADEDVLTVSNLLSLQTTVCLQEQTFPCRWMTMYRPQESSSIREFIKGNGTLIVWKNVFDDEKAFVTGVLRDAQTRNTNTLQKQRDPLIPQTMAFLKSMGIPTQLIQRSGIRFQNDGPKIDPHKTYTWGNAFRLEGSQIVKAMQSAQISYPEPYVTRDQAHRHTFPDNPIQHDIDIMDVAHLIAVSGPVWIVADENGKSIPATKTPVYSVSIPGLNLAYSNSDKNRYIQNGINGIKTINAAGVTRIRNMWHHVLWICSWAHIEYPVLCAIGCGAFAGSVKDAPEVYANALVDVLGSFGRTFNCIFLSLIGGSNYDGFKRVIERRASELVAPIALTSAHGMLGIAHYLANKGKSVAILNPSDAQAVREGSMGMYWNYGDAAVEELLAVQTTLLLQHIDINADLWAKPDRTIPITNMSLSLAQKEPYPPM
jgi:hypothetical protein